MKAIACAELESLTSAADHDLVIPPAEPVQQVTPAVIDLLLAAEKEMANIHSELPALRQAAKSKLNSKK